MSSTGQFSSKNPTIRRILKEASELNTSPSADYHAAPLETDLFEWHFTLRGPPAPSPYDGGLYHGRIVLPPAYPLKPPSFRFTTPTGRFEVNREICLSISGHHEETWQPAWGIRTALVAIRSFMDTDAKGQVGGMDASDETRKKYAAQSGAWKCPTCAKTNDAIMKEHDETVLAAGQNAAAAKESVPEELRLAYREDLKSEGSQSAEGSSRIEPTASVAAPSVSTPQEPVIAHNTVAAAPAVATHPQQVVIGRQEVLPPWIDQAIFGIILALAALVWIRYGI